MPKYKQIAIPMRTFKGFELMKDEVRFVKAFRKDDIHILSTQDKTPKWGWLKHFSISCQYRYPTWEEILEAKEFLFGDIDAMMIMPKKKDYVSIHPNCFHVWACPESWDIQ